MTGRKRTPPPAAAGQAHQPPAAQADTRLPGTRPDRAALTSGNPPATGQADSSPDTAPADTRTPGGHRLTAAQEAEMAELVSAAAERDRQRTLADMGYPGAAPGQPVNLSRLLDPSRWQPRRHLRPRQRCTARRTNGQPCRAWAIHGGTVCAAHGGRAPQVRAAASRRLEQAALEAYSRSEFGRAWRARAAADRAEVAAALARWGAGYPLVDGPGGSPAGESAGQDG